MIPNFYIDLRETLFLHKEGILSSYTSMENSNNLKNSKVEHRYIFMSIDRYNNDLYTELIRRLQDLKVLY